MAGNTTFCQLASCKLHSNKDNASTFGGSVLRGFCVTLMLAALLSVKASALTVEELDLGERIRGPNLGLKDLTGKVVLIDLWGIQCGPCIAQMPALQELY